MSLVNDMLRDLEKRRAAPGDSPLADDLYAVDEAAAARRDRSLRLRRGLLWFAAVMLGAFLIGNLLGLTHRRRHHHDLATLAHQPVDHKRSHRSRTGDVQSARGSRLRQGLGQRRPRHHRLGQRGNAHKSPHSTHNSPQSVWTGGMARVLTWRTHPTSSCGH